MATEQARFYCLDCKQPRLFTRQGTNHIIHLLLTLFLCGLWLPIWLLISISDQRNAYYCSQCGYAGSPSDLANPRRTQERIIEAQQRSRQKTIEPQSDFSKFLNAGNTDWKIATMLLGFVIVFFGAIYLLALRESNNNQSAPVSIPAAPIHQVANPVPEPKTNAELLAKAKQLLTVRPVDKIGITNAMRHLRAIPRGAKEYPEAQRLLQDAKKKGWD